MKGTCAQSIFKSLTLLAICLIIQSCSSTQSNFKTCKIDESASLTTNSILYNLPKTTLKIRVTSKEVINIPGPFNQYSERYLGISDYVSKKEVKWEITNISVTPLLESDATNYYSITGNTSQLKSVFDFTNEGLILPASNILTQKKLTQNEAELKLEKPLFKSVSLYPIEGAASDTVYKRILRDNEYIRVPVLQSQVIAKNEKEKAEDAAKSIFDIRKNRINIITGENEHMPDGKAMEVLLLELARQETEFLSLFIGKTFERVVYTDFYYSPELSETGNPIVVFRFNTEAGVLQPDDLRGKPVILEFTKENKTEALRKVNSFNKESKKARKNELIYRIPEIANFVISYNGDKLYSNRIPIYQFGEITQFKVK